MRPVKIVVIGAGSVSFGPGSLRDAMQMPELRGSQLILVDVDETNLELMTRLARRMNDEAGTGLIIEGTTDRRRALPEADFVITSVAVRRDELWRLDWEIPRRHGIRQVLGENGGPGGLSHALRNIPIILDICRDMEELCPNAYLINFSNPESRICMAVSKYTSIRTVGLCHGVFMGRDRVAEILGRRGEDLDVKAAGVNHLVWLLDIRDRHTGEDLYPLLREKEAALPPDAPGIFGPDPLSRAMFRHFGYWPAPTDDHIGEYLPYAWELTGLEGYDFAAADRHRKWTWERIRRMAAGEEPLGDLLTKPSGELAFPIIRAITENRNEYVLAVNIPNRGCITNLPSDAIVEVPALVSGFGVQGLTMGDLPPGIAALCSAQVHVQRLAVEAAVHGDRRLAMQALLVDPVVDSISAAEKTLAELLDVHAPYLPQFRQDRAQSG
ncbi:alpha-glucosidase/alpha-galactosidase [Alicyclobacillus cellulosilyticus]|uniref:Alpha-glucosidase/alpha-galactosidase n=1 Tax=Alicyclobacillus cellulosilyticus TaxID=1003997 RepID=A0A917NIB9_9BACL|nr:alpha-glucosidase/alpha-galactosidase [Alicyclobacillus cellulosilyticus]GGJ02652.1 alpha-glucosidase/alpha-galactosidase [Alicyclobacillus cellulosilyticus]